MRRPMAVIYPIVDCSREAKPALRTAYCTPCQRFGWCTTTCLELGAHAKRVGHCPAPNRRVGSEELPLSTLGIEEFVLHGVFFFPVNDFPNHRISQREGSCASCSCLAWGTVRVWGRFVSRRIYQGPESLTLSRGNARRRAHAGCACILLVFSAFSYLPCCLRVCSHAFLGYLV